MNNKIIIGLLIIISLGISYFVVDNISEKRAIKKAKIEKEERIKKREEENRVREEEWVKYMEKKKREAEKEEEEELKAAELKERRRKAQSGKCYEYWSLDYNTRAIAKNGATRFKDFKHSDEDMEKIELYKKCGKDKPVYW